MTSTPSSPHCTLAVVRALTKPLIDPPQASTASLREALLLPWEVRIPVDPDDDTTRSHWQHQPHTTLSDTMFDWQPPPGTFTASLHPYFSFGSPGSPFFEPDKDVGNCLKQLLLHRIASHQTYNSIVLSCHDADVFVATSAAFEDSDLERIRSAVVSRVHAEEYYLLRCHYNKDHQKLIFGHHSAPDDACQFRTFHELVEISLSDDNWRLTTCIVLKNLARILHCLQDFAVPLVWSSSRKLQLIRTNPAQQRSYAHDTHDKNQYAIQKIYETKHICNITQNATVANMISIYQALKDNNVPHTDRLLSVEEHNGERYCQFGPVGRSYLPQNVTELMEALVCVCEALVAMHAVGIMHRDIRWANVFHAFPTDDMSEHENPENELDRSHEWVLFDFEFAAFAPQPAFAAHTLTPGNHAPCMVLHDELDGDMEYSQKHPEHGLAVDIWGVGLLLQSAAVDIPVSHAVDLSNLQAQCLNANPADRPSAVKCLAWLRNLQQRPVSTEKEFLSAVV